jgi:solute:Na+ symporter, SSS family
MNALDHFVLVGTMVAIAVYGVWRTRRNRNLAAYLKSGHALGWGTIGLSVMATQASAITFLSIPGQGYESGLGFVQIYFGLPIALIIVSAVFLPIYQRLNVYTAYEYLGKRFDPKTRMLGAGLFLLQRGLASGITIYAPAIILSTVLGWRLDVTILGTGMFVIIYTVLGGNEAVSVTQKWQMAVIFAGMVAAFVVVIGKLPAEIGLGDALAVAGGFNKLDALNFKVDFDTRYTVWAGLLGGVFLSLSYFGTDQSQVQRYLSGGSLREGRLGLMFNALLKIPMQFFILLLGTLVFVFYQFSAPPVFFNQAAWGAQVNGETSATFRALEADYAEAHATKRDRIADWMAARRAGDLVAAEASRSAMLAAHERSQAVRTEAKSALVAASPAAKTNDTDYVFITFVLEHMPHGIVGLIVALIFAAAISSLSSELVALASTSAVDFYRHVLRRDASDTHYVRASQWLVLIWGAIAIAFALFANLTNNLIQAINILGSIFYGVVLGIFLVAFFLRKVGGTAVFWGAAAAQLLVFFLYWKLTISFLWFNFIGCALCVTFSLALHVVLRERARPPAAAGSE